MAVELRLQLKLSQQLVMTPQLQQAIKLLQLNRLELANMVEQELQENPMLEEMLESEEQPTEGELSDATPGEEFGDNDPGESADGASAESSSETAEPAEPAAPEVDVEAGGEAEVSDVDKISDVEWKDRTAGVF